MLFCISFCQSLTVASYFLHVCIILLLVYIIILFLRKIFSRKCLAEEIHRRTVHLGNGVHGQNVAELVKVACRPGQGHIRCPKMHILYDVLGT